MDGERLSLSSIRDSLIRQEDTIIFSLIERAQHPFNSPTYCSNASLGASVVEFLVKETEIAHAKLGRYESPEEHPFFPDDLPESLLPDVKHSQVLHPASTDININKTIWKMYFEELLPLITVKDDNGSYLSTAACDLACLQALSRRIHYGKFVAESKYRDAPQDYGPAIQASDRDTLMRLLTFEKVEEMVKRRVENKGRVFGQEIGSESTVGTGKQKLDPSVLPLLYDK